MGIADAIRAGLRKEMLQEYPDSTGGDLRAMGYGALSSIVERLISDDEATRDRAKQNVLRLIEMGKG